MVSTTGEDVRAHFGLSLFRSAVVLAARNHLKLQLEECDKEPTSVAFHVVAPEPRTINLLWAVAWNNYRS